jgi:hypothetical protein
MEVVVLATYYFMILGDQTIKHALTMTKVQQDVLLSICERIRVTKQMPTDSPKVSKVVKLRIRVPLELFRENLRAQNGSARQISQQSDSSVENLGSEPEGFPDPLGKRDSVVANDMVRSIIEAANIVVTDIYRTLQAW